MIRRPPRSTPKPSSAASDVYKRQGILYSVTGYLVLAKNVMARQLNSALLASAVVMRGCRTFVQTMLDWDDDDDDGIWPWVGRALDGAVGGILMTLMAAKSYRSYTQKDEAESDSKKKGRANKKKDLVTTLGDEPKLAEAPAWVRLPLQSIEKSIDVIADKLDAVV